MLELIIYFFAILNPFALFVYTMPLNKALGLQAYLNVFVRASLIAFVIYVFFAIFGERFFTEVLKIQYDSFRIFGGLVLVGFALSFIIQGKESIIAVQGGINNLATKLALPFIVGAGTITLSIVLGTRLGPARSVVALAIIMLLAIGTVAILAWFRQILRRRMQDVLDKILEILLRINGFIVGAFGVDLIVIGVQNLMS